MFEETDWQFLAIQEKINSFIKCIQSSYITKESMPVNVNMLMWKSGSFG